MSPIKATNKQTHNSKCQTVQNQQTDRHTIRNVETPQGIISKIMKPPIIKFSIVPISILTLAYCYS